MLQSFIRFSICSVLSLVFIFRSIEPALAMPRLATTSHSSLAHPAFVEPVTESVIAIEILEYLLFEVFAEGLVGAAAELTVDAAAAELVAAEAAAAAEVAAAEMAAAEVAAEIAAADAADSAIYRAAVGIPGFGSRLAAALSTDSQVVRQAWEVGNGAMILGVPAHAIYKSYKSHSKKMKKAGTPLDPCTPVPTIVRGKPFMVYDFDSCSSEFHPRKRSWLHA